MTARGTDALRKCGGYFSNCVQRIVAYATSVSRIYSFLAKLSKSGPMEIRL
jgi:hypothetical protein